MNGKKMNENNNFKIFSHPFLGSCTSFLLFFIFIFKLKLWSLTLKRELVI